jgi:hypothetical protein
VSSAATLTTCCWLGACPRYEVRRKSKGMVQEIKEMMVSRFCDHRGRTQCGIIYCLSRAECERVAAELQCVKQRNGRMLSAGWVPGACSVLLTCCAECML